MVERATQLGTRETARQAKGQCLIGMAFAMALEGLLVWYLLELRFGMLIAARQLAQ